MSRTRLRRVKRAFCFLLLPCLTLVATAPLAAQTIDLEDIPLQSMSFDNGHPDGEGVADAGTISGGGTYSGAHVSRGASLNFNGGVDAQFGFFFWGGWAISNMTDNTTIGFMNQYSAFHDAAPGAGSGGSTNYAVGFTGGSELPAIVLPAGTSPLSIDLNNTTYTALSMLTGDAFAFPFGGPDGDEPDQFTLTITGNNGGGSIDFLLADYSFTDNALDYVVDQWTTVDLRSLAPATELSFVVTTTDIGDFGPNTPLYFAVDNLIVDNLIVTNPAVSTPEPSAAILLLSALLGLLTVSFRRRCLRAGR